MVDFGADEACGKAAEKLKEHHGLEVCEKQSAEVLEELARRLEPESEPEENAPARRAHRYLDKRRDQLDYQSALGRGLPVGSGIIESGRRHVLQARLKIPAHGGSRRTPMPWPNCAPAGPTAYGAPFGSIETPSDLIALGGIALTFSFSFSAPKVFSFLFSQKCPFSPPRFCPGYF